MDFKIHPLNANTSGLLERVAPDVFDNTIDTLQLRLCLAWYRYR
jgi:hypothetical protein